MKKKVLLDRLIGAFMQIEFTASFMTANRGQCCDETAKEN